MERRTLGRSAGGAMRGRAGFTLVELLVVIIIIAILAALAVPAVMRATATAQNARIKTEIDMLHQAIMQYKNEYGSFPPAVDGPPGTVNKHIQRLFPRATSGVPAAMLPLIQPDTALSTWLSGFNTDDPTAPMNGNRKKLFDFDESRRSGDRYWPPTKPKSPYIYIPSTLYTYGSGASLTIPVYQFGNLAFRPPYNGYFAHRTATPSAPNDFMNLNQPAFNPDTFQILCAGRDEIFGTDDDMSNFWTGTRKDYQDSLK